MRSKTIRKKKSRSCRTRSKKRLYKQRGGVARLEGETDEDYINRFLVNMRKETQREDRNKIGKKIVTGEKIKRHLLSRAYRKKKKECLMKSMDEFDDINDVKKNSDDYKTCKDRAKQKYYEGRL